MEQGQNPPQDLPQTEQSIGTRTEPNNIPHLPPYITKRNIVLALCAAIILVPILYSFILVPRMGHFKHHQPELTNFMKYRMQQAKKRGNGFTATYTFIPLREISPSLIRAVIYAEDSKFYQHRGVDWGSILTSFTQNIKRHRVVWGGSTITMQLCKNMFLYPKKTLWRKYLELILTWRIEHTLSKPRILELYLNVIEWGPGIFGAENAAQYYFNKSACFLDDEEASLLAAIIMAPRSYKKEKPNPFFEARQQWVYSFMTTGEVTEPTADIFFDFTIDPELPLGVEVPTGAWTLQPTEDIQATTQNEGVGLPAVTSNEVSVSGDEFIQDTVRELFRRSKRSAPTENPDRPQ